MKMIIAIALKFMFLMVEISNVFGRLVVLRGVEYYSSYSYNDRKLLCISDEDGGALVWNSNLDWQYSSYQFLDMPRDTSVQHFYCIRQYGPQIRSPINCDMHPQSQCTAQWNPEKWSSTSSIDKPMGPVLDRRWEGFRQYGNFKMIANFVFIFEQRNIGVLAFSVRGITDAHLALCHDRNYSNSFCYWIIIGGWENKRSVIRKCANGLPPTYPAKESECAEPKVLYNHEPLSPVKWTTFILKWNATEQSITLYDMNKIIFKYIDTGHVPESLKDKYHLFMKSVKPMLIRFHIYDFLHTTEAEAVLTSPTIQVTNSNLCVQMFVGLCTKCQMDIFLIDTQAPSKIDKLMVVDAPFVSRIYDLPTWQKIKINTTIPTGFGEHVELKIVSKLKENVLSGLWAIGNIEECQPEGTIMLTKMTAIQDYTPSTDKYYWPNVTCQKLLYNDTQVVSSISPVTFDLKPIPDDYHCENGKVGPYCSIDCKADLGLNYDCLRGTICEEEGCSCRVGLHGKNCETYCGVGKYGYGCLGTCDTCKDMKCNFITGECRHGCDNTQKYHIPPFCKIGIDLLPPPNIDIVRETSAQISLIAKDEYKIIPTSYIFTIESNAYKYPAHLTYIKPDTRELVQTFDDLEPGTTYKVYGTLYVEQNSVTINGNETIFTTLCAPSTAFDVMPNETSLVLNTLQSHELHPCPAKWYSIYLEEISTGKNITNPVLMQFPIKYNKLTPFTLYKINIYRLEKNLFTQEIRTFDAAPSEVVNLRTFLLSSTSVTLKWDRPLQENGIIVDYTITLQVETYLGCEVLKRQVESEQIKMTTTNTTITLTNLHPYTSYTVTVFARTSKSGPKNKLEFTTDATELPTAVPSKLSITNYMLTWDDPEDCKTISGPITGSKLKFWGISENVKSFTDERRTSYKFFQLASNRQTIYGQETYKARAFFTRNSYVHNESAYQELLFTTPPKAPPPVQYLEQFEVDPEAMTMSLRWKPPEQPTNGEIEYYSVAYCNTQCTAPVATVMPNLTCELWHNYICATVNFPRQWFRHIEVRAHNKKVSSPGPSPYLQNEQTEKPPDTPGDFKCQSLGGGVIQLNWTHPWKTGAPLRAFVIGAQLISTKLRDNQLKRVFEHNYTLSKYQLHYTERLGLLPSSEYELSIHAKTKNKISSKSLCQVRIPSSIAFDGELKWEVYNTDSTILVQIPTIVNDTQNSAMYVIVTGPGRCAQHSKLDTVLSRQTDIKYYAVAWIAGILSTTEYSGKSFIVGDNNIYGGATNCPLYPQESYTVFVVVQTERGSIDEQFIIAETTSIYIGEVPKRPNSAAWIIPIMLFLLAAVVAYIFYRRRANRNMEKRTESLDDMPLSKTANSEANSLPESPYEFKKTLTRSSSDNECLSQRSTPDFVQTTEQPDEKEITSSLVKVKDFQDYVKKIINSGHLEKQYEMFPRGPTQPCEYGKLPQNKAKNRYANLIAYDKRRVILTKLPDNPHSDYINANYISGYKKDKAYIATQGPKPNTVIDFWRMIWQEEVHIICMLANVIENGKTKCEQYWPDIGKKKKYGDIVVLNAKHNVFADFTFRTWHVTCGQATRKIEHLHYTAWPDHGVPLYTHSVVTYLKKLLATPAGNGPVVVHCSAGVGRTGTIILCDICLRRAAAEGVVDIIEEIRIIRSQRANMVDNKQQFLFAHVTLVECLLALPTALSCNEMLPSKIKDLKKQLAIQLQRLEDTAWLDEALRPSTMTQTLTAQNIAKNRYPDLILEKTSRIYLKRYPPSDEDSDYISAVYVDGVKVQNQYLASQLPMPNTLSDFWRMVAEFKVELVIMLQPTDPEDSTCCTIAPKIGDLKPTSYINLKSEDITETEYYMSHKILLTDNSEKPARQQFVTILCCSQWKPGKNQEPPSTISLVSLWQAAEKISRGDGPTVTLCHDGVFGCGLFLALSFLLERMAVERECDVCLAVRAVRRSRPDFVRSLEQLEYLYDAAITYLQYFETYANFS